MSDTPPVNPPAPTWLQRVCTALLPQFIAYSRKGLIWFSGLGVGGVLELAKESGQRFGWNEAQVFQWNTRLLLAQAAILFVAKCWTQQIADEDKALKTGLPPPSGPSSPQNVAGGNITVIEKAPSPIIDPAAAGERK